MQASEVPRAVAAALSSASALAMIVTWRWDRDDDLPNGRRLGQTWLNEMRAALERYELDME